MMRMLLIMAGALLVSIVSAAESYPEPDDRKLAQGRALWMDNCESCHAYGIADAPVPMRPDEWRYRLIKGKQVLYEHAIDGFIGPGYSMMPARGGNEKLNDDEVKLAVDYMIFLAGYYMNNPETDKEVNNDSTTN